MRSPTSPASADSGHGPLAALSGDRRAFCERRITTQGANGAVGERHPVWLITRRHPFESGLRYKMETTHAPIDRIWYLTTWGDTLGIPLTEDSHSGRMLERGNWLPSEEAAETVARQWKKWLATKGFNHDVKGEYFVASAEGPFKIKVGFRREGDQLRQEYGNQFRDQGEAHIASEALAWLIGRAREKSGVV